MIHDSARDFLAYEFRVSYSGFPQVGTVSDIVAEVSRSLVR